MKVRFLLFILLLLIVFNLCGCGNGPPGKSAKGPVEITVWHPYGGISKEQFVKVCELFNSQHPGIRVRAVFNANDLSNNQKFFTSIVARTPPDVAFVDGPQTAAWAQMGSLEPLDDRIKAAGIRASDFYAPCWNQNFYKGHVWALTFCADPNFAFIWNKKVFREVGLDPERPPRTIKELDDYNRRITRIVDGRIVRFGIIPWGQFGAANSLFTWGWAFGGSFYDPETRKITADNSGVVKALEWMQSYSRDYGVTNIGAFASGFGSRDQDPFYLGKIAMKCMHYMQIEEIRRYAPDLDYGVGFIPAPEDGEQHSSWVGGWCVAIPKGSRHPDEAWEFIRWISATADGTNAVGTINNFLPGWKKSPFFRSIRGSRVQGHFVKILDECRHQRPVMPAQAFFMGSLDRAVNQAVYRSNVDARNFLAKCGKDTQAELDIILQGGD